MKRRKEQRRRRAEELAKKEAAGDFSHLKNKKGEIVGRPQPQPTLPVLSVDDDFNDVSSIKPRGPPGGLDGYYGDQKSIVDYPIMPAYNQPYSHHQAPGYPQYNPSVPTVYDDRYDDETGSQVHLASSAASIPRGGSADPHYGYVADHYNVYYSNDQKDAYGQQADYPQPSRTPAPVYDPYPQDSYAHTQRDAYGADAYGVDAYYQQSAYGQGQPQQRGGDRNSDGANGYGRAQ